MPGVELVGVADARCRAGGGRRRAVPARRPSPTTAELLDAVDAVTVAVPTVMHREVAGAFLARGIATMVEKPMAGTLAEAEQLVALARATGAVLQVGHIERFNPALQALDGLAVRPKYINAERLSTYTFRSTDIGVVLDLMIHDLDLILAMIAAPVRSVAAVGVSVFGEHEDVANARIEFEDGSVANVTASRASYQAVRKMRIWGAGGLRLARLRRQAGDAGPPLRATPPGPARPRGPGPQPAGGDQGARLRQDPPGRPGRSARAPSRWPWSSRTSSRRRGASRAPGRRRGRPPRHAAGRPGAPEPGSPPMGRRRAPGSRHRPSPAPPSRVRMPGGSRTPGTPPTSTTLADRCRDDHRSPKVPGAIGHSRKTPGLAMTELIARL